MVDKFPNCSTLLYDARTGGHCSPLHTWETSITYQTSPVTERQSGGLKYFLPPAKYFLCAGSWSRSMNCARQPSGRPLYTRGRPWLRCLRPAADLATSARHNRGRAGHSNKFIFSTAAAVIISACNSPPSIIRYLMVTSRGDVGYNCNGYQSLVIFTHINLLLCFIGACADL